jgi:hypothetical protein
MKYKYPCKDCIVKGICSDMRSCPKNGRTIHSEIYTVKNRHCMDCGSDKGYQDVYNHKLIICTECRTMYSKSTMNGFAKYHSKCANDVSNYRVITFAEFVKSNGLDEWIGE